MRPELPSVAVVVPTYHGDPDTISRLLDSIEASDYRGSIDIHLVDDGTEYENRNDPQTRHSLIRVFTEFQERQARIENRSLQSSPDLAQGEVDHDTRAAMGLPQVRLWLTSQQRNFGKRAAHIAALRGMDGTPDWRPLPPGFDRGEGDAYRRLLAGRKGPDILILTDDDCKFKRDTIGEMVEALRQPGVVAATGRGSLADPPGLRRWSPRWLLRRAMIEVPSHLERLVMETPLPNGQLYGLWRETLLRVKDLYGLEPRHADDKGLNNQVMRLGKVAYAQRAVCTTEQPGDNRRRLLRWRRDALRHDPEFTDNYCRRIAERGGRLAPLEIAMMRGYMKLRSMPWSPLTREARRTLDSTSWETRGGGGQREGDRMFRDVRQHELAEGLTGMTLKDRSGTTMEVVGFNRRIKQIALLVRESMTTVDIGRLERDLAQGHLMPVVADPDGPDVAGPGPTDIHNSIELV